MAVLHAALAPGRRLGGNLTLALARGVWPGLPDAHDAVSQYAPHIAPTASFGLPGAHGQAGARGHQRRQQAQ